MTEPRLTPDQFAEIIKASKPYLVEIEERVAAIGYGSIEVKLEVRAGVVERMDFFEGKRWLKDKAIDTKSKG